MEANFGGIIVFGLTSPEILLSIPFCRDSHHQKNLKMLHVKHSFENLRNLVANLNQILVEWLTGCRLPTFLSDIPIHWSLWPLFLKIILKYSFLKHLEQWDPNFGKLFLRGPFAELYLMTTPTIQDSNSKIKPCEALQEMDSEIFLS